MRGSPRGQATGVLMTMKAFGESRHAAKKKAYDAGARTFHEINKDIGIHSTATMTIYIARMTEMLKWVRKNHNVRDAQKLLPEHVEAWLDSKIRKGVSRRTLTQYCAAAQKFSAGLKKMDQKTKTTDDTRDWSSMLAETRKIGKEKLKMPHEPRAYERPSVGIKNLENFEEQLVASMQLYGGARISEVVHIDETQLRAEGVWLENTKGGRPRMMRLPKWLHEAVTKYVREHGSLDVDSDEYRGNLKDAMLVAGEKWCGTHGLRWNFAQDRYDQLVSSGLSEKQANLQISQEIGHNREDITQWYQKR